MHYKIPIQQARQIIDDINTKWLKWYDENARPKTDGITNAYCALVEIDDFGYIIKDDVTEQYITGDWDVVETLPIIKSEEFPENPD